MYELAWTLEQLGQTIQAERLAAAERYRLMTAAPRSSQSPRMALASALRALASRLDGPEPRIAHTRCRPKNGRLSHRH
jgi:hypothetical protein